MTGDGIQVPMLHLKDEVVEEEVVGVEVAEEGDVEVEEVVVVEVLVMLVVVEVVEVEDTIMNVTPKILAMLMKRLSISYCRLVCNIANVRCLMRRMMLGINC